MEEMEIILSLLREIEIDKEFLDRSNPAGLDQTFVRSVLLLIEHDLIEGDEEVRMTNLGHKFLNAVRDQEDWDRVKDRLENTVEDIDTVTLAEVIATAIKMIQGDS